MAISLQYVSRLFMGIERKKKEKGRRAILCHFIEFLKIPPINPTESACTRYGCNMCHARGKKDGAGDG